MCVDSNWVSPYVYIVKSDDVMLKLIKRYGIRRALTLFGAAGIAAARGWDAMVGDEAYSRQAVWMWKRDLDVAGVDPAKVEWSGFEQKVSRDLGLGLEGARAKLREKKAARDARAVRGRARA
jgi:hypothetical protein